MMTRLLTLTFIFLGLACERPPVVVQDSFDAENIELEFDSSHKCIKEQFKNLPNYLEDEQTKNDFFSILKNKNIKKVVISSYEVDTIACSDYEVEGLETIHECRKDNTEIESSIKPEVVISIRDNILEINVQYINQAIEITTFGIASKSAFDKEGMEEIISTNMENFKSYVESLEQQNIVTRLDNFVIDQAKCSTLLNETEILELINEF